VRDIVDALGHGEVVNAVPSAWVEVLNGNSNIVHVSVTEFCERGCELVSTTSDLVRNNSDNTHAVEGLYGTYYVFVSARGNNQIRQIHIVRFVAE
jgi:hypothetical protein